jgi:diguanylate cyclase (GGDEF)-like protein
LQRPSRSRLLGVLILLGCTAVIVAQRVWLTLHPAIRQFETQINDVTLIAANVFAIVASLVAMTKRKGTARTFWALFACASIFQLCGNAGWAYVRYDHLAIPASALFPSIFYRFYAGPLAIALFLSGSVRNSRFGTFLDGCIVVGLVGLTMYQVQMVEVAAHHPKIWQSITVTSLVNVVLVLAVTVRFLLCTPGCLRGLFARQLVYVLSYSCVALVTSIADAYLPLVDRYSSYLWIATYVMAAAVAATWHPPAEDVHYAPRLSRRASLLCFNLTLATLVLTGAILGLRLVDTTRIVGLAGMTVVLFSFAIRSALAQDTQEGTLVELQASRVELKRQALYDHLTGLPNRRLLADRLAQALAIARRDETMLGLFYLDLDGFKPINDRFGHATGDQVLIEIARRLRAKTRESDTVARVGGDEFTLVMTRVTAREQVELLARDISRFLSDPIAIEGELFTVTASIGFALFPEDSREAESLLAIADKAMYDAKRENKRSARLHAPSLGSARVSQSGSGDTSYQPEHA